MTTVFIRDLNGDKTRLEVWDYQDLVDAIHEHSGYGLSKFDLFSEGEHITSSKKSFEAFELTERIELDICYSPTHVRITDDMIDSIDKKFIGWDIVSLEAACGCIEDWDTSFVTDMNNCFSYNYDFNRDISKWDVSSVTDMSFMFESARSFNQPIGNWDVSNVNDMEAMFTNATNFNQSLDKWDVSNVDDMDKMFCGATSFNGGIYRHPQIVNN
jgi:surface protein